MIHLKDEELIDLFQQGNEIAFCEVYLRYKDNLHIMALSLLRNQDDAKDLTQELFTKIWDRKDNITFTLSLSAYLCKTLHNMVMDIISHEKVIAKYQKSLSELMNEGESPTDNYMKEKELSGVIEEKIATLPDKMRKVFELSRKMNLSHHQIASELNISENTVKKHISLAIRKLKDSINSY
ncbi:MAG: RNA polymerase sigma-70 factor [Paludibacter sp.]|nr:RNA polymerase sigma-70 factor [Paludibacter sp.]